MKKGVLFLFVLILVSHIVIADDITFAPEPIELSIKKETLKNGDIKLFQRNLPNKNYFPVTQFNPTKLKQIFHDATDDQEKLLIKHKISRKVHKIFVTGYVTADTTNKKLTIKIFKPTAGDPVKPPQHVSFQYGDFLLEGKELTLQVTKDKDILVSSSGKDASLTVELKSKKHKLKCRDGCKLDLIVRLNPINRKKYILNITGNAYFSIKDENISSQKVPKGLNVFYDLNMSDLSNIIMGSHDIFFAMRANAFSQTSSFGDVRIESKRRVELSTDVFKQEYSPYPERSFAVQIPTIVGYDIKIKENKANILNLFNPKGEVSKNGITYYEGNKEIFELKKGDFYVLKIVSSYFTIPIVNLKSTIQLIKNKATVSLKKDHNMIVKFPPGPQKYNWIEFFKFEPTDTKSYAYVEKQIGGQRKNLIFKRSKVSVGSGSKWSDYGYSFNIPLFDPSVKVAVVKGEIEKAYSMFECRLNENKCYLNGKQVTDFAKQKIRHCKRQTDCPQGQDCIRGICVNKIKCQKLNIPGMNGPIGLVFINDKIVPKADFKDVVKEITGLSDGTPLKKSIFNAKISQQMFNKEPYKSIKDKYTIYYIDDADLPLGSLRGTPLIGLSGTFARKMCPPAKHAVVLSSKLFGSAALYDGNAFISKNDLGISINSLSHEYAHACCRVDDEYYIENSGSKFATNYYKRGKPYFNCARNDADAAKKGWATTLISQAKAGQWRGCGGGCPTGCSQWLKPSKDSIMSKALHFDTYNAFTAKGIKDRLMRIK